MYGGDDPAIGLNTYRFLRLGMAIVLLALGWSVAMAVNDSSGCWQRSVSAYYYTPSRTVFVGALVALGMAMVALLGNTPVENLFLNMAGLFAPIVAFVPTREFNACSLVSPTGVIQGDETSKAAQDAAREAAEAAARAAVTNNVTTYLVVLLVTLAILPAVLMALGTGHQRSFYKFGYVAACVFLLMIGVWFFCGRHSFNRHAHLTSAVLLFTCILVVVASNGYDRTAPSPAKKSRVLGFLRRLWRSLRDRYGLLAVGMVASVVVVAVIHSQMEFVHWFLAIEISLLGFFFIFWIVQTCELWKEGYRVKPSAVVRVGLSQKP